MLSKKPAILLSTYGTVQSLPAGSTTSPRRCTESTRPQLTSYATIADSEGRHNGSDNERHREVHAWPEPPKGQSCPTPYQIFAMKHNASYTKSRFNELVKLYHPDIDNGSNVTHHVKMERYRLIVAAHSILSDPVKRSAYDRFGAGWEGRAEAAGSGARSGSHQPGGPFGRNRNDASDPIWQNATWEDWERFYARRANEHTAQGVHQPQAPVYMRNSYFLALVILLAIIGSSANYNRAQDAGAYFIDQRDVVHDRAAKELRKIRQEMSGMRGRDERIQWFLRQREAAMGQMAGTDVEAMNEERANRVLPRKEVCRSDDISGKET